MASITIRNLDDDVKKGLRLRAAEHSRSMEENVRSRPRRRVTVASAKLSGLATAVVWMRSPSRNFCRRGRCSKVGISHGISPYIASSAGPPRRGPPSGPGSWPRLQDLPARASVARAFINDGALLNRWDALKHPYLGPSDTPMSQKIDHDSSSSLRPLQNAAATSRALSRSPGSLRAFEGSGLRARFRGARGVLSGPNAPSYIRQAARAAPMIARILPCSRPFLVAYQIQLKRKCMFPKTQLKQFSNSTNETLRIETCLLSVLFLEYFLRAVVRQNTEIPSVGEQSAPPLLH